MRLSSKAQVSRKVQRSMERRIIEYQAKMPRFRNENCLTFEKSRAFLQVCVTQSMLSISLETCKSASFYKRCSV